MLGGAARRRAFGAMPAAVRGGWPPRAVAAWLAVATGALLGLVPAAAGAATAPGPDPAAPGTTLAQTWGSGERAYPYLVYVPTTYDAARPAPLVVIPHGCQTTAEQQMNSDAYPTVAEREGIVLLYPDVTKAEATDPAMRGCWRFFDATNWRRDGNDTSAIAGMTRTVMARWRIDPERVYVMGMSAGGFTTSNLTATYPDLYAAAAVLSASSYADSTCLAGNPLTRSAADSAQLARAEMGRRARVVPRLVMGGSGDVGIVPACHEKALEQGLRTNNLVLGGRQASPISLTPSSTRYETTPVPNGRLSTVQTFRDPDGCIVGERWNIHGMGHQWPGGTTDNERRYNNDNTAPDAAEVTWRFFRRYTRSSTAMPCAEADPAPTAAPPSRTTSTRRCGARWITVSAPRGATRLRATVAGRSVRVRIRGGRVQVRRPATTRTRSTLVVRGRSAAGRAFTRRVTDRGCASGS